MKKVKLDFALAKFLYQTDGTWGLFFTPPGTKLSQEQCGIYCKTANSKLRTVIHFKRQQIIDVPVSGQFKGSQKLFSSDLIKWPDSVSNTELGKENPTSIASQIMK